MKIIKVGHSEIHPRQNLLTLEMAKNSDVEILSFSPNVWGDEIVPNHVVGLTPIFTDGQQSSFANMILKGLELTAEMQPDIVWCMQEPHTFLAMQCRNIAKQSGAKLVVFTWENKPDLRFSGVFSYIEKEVLRAADLVVCGNSGAVERVRSIEPKANTIILPQTGVDTTLFEPVPEIVRDYDIGYFGRFVEEKIGTYNELLKRRADLRSLSIGGRGSVRIFRGDVIPWIEYSKLHLYYNRLKCFLSLPYNYNGFNEQFNYSICEALSCGIPVIASKNGSIPEIYRDAPNLYLSDEGSIDHVLYYLEQLKSFRIEEQKELSKRGRQWVIDNLSLQAIASKYIKTFEELIK